MLDQIFLKIADTFMKLLVDTFNRGQDEKRKASSSLRSLYEALCECHEAYLPVAAMTGPQQDPEAWRTYTKKIEKLINVILAHRVALQIHAPDAYAALLGYTDTEIGYVGDESKYEEWKLRRMVGGLANDLVAGKETGFEESRERLGEFIRSATTYGSMVK